MKQSNNPSNSSEKQIRLNRFISQCGIASRRKADELIEKGHIKINGKVITELGTKIDPEKDHIEYKNKTLSTKKLVYLVLNKPSDTITTVKDTHNRKTVMELIDNEMSEFGLFPIGRLDKDTTGVLIISNDGDLSNKLLHPSQEIEKVYKVTLNKNLKDSDFNHLKNGIHLEDGFIKPDEIAFPDKTQRNVVGIEIHSGKNRIVRRMFKSLGYHVDKLDRTLFAGISTQNLPIGQYRMLKKYELINLWKLVS